MELNILKNRKDASNPSPQYHITKQKHKNTPIAEHNYFLWVRTKLQRGQKKIYSIIAYSKKQHPVNCEVTYKRSLQQLVSQLTDNLAWLCPPHGQMTKPWETENAAFSQKNCACNISNSQCFPRPNSHHFIRTKFVLSSPDYSTRRTWNGTNAIF